MAPKKPIKSTPRPEPRPEPKTESKSNKKSAKSNENSFWKRFKYIITDERTRFVIGIVVLLSTIYLLVSFISYFFTGAADYSTFDSQTGVLDKAHRIGIQNWASSIGAYLSEKFINQWFGVSSFAIVIFFFVLGLRFMKARVASLWKTFFHCCFWLIWLSVLLGYVLYSYKLIYPDKDMFFFSIAGQHGEGANEWLTSYVGMPGTLMILIGTFLIYAVIASRQTIPFLKSILLFVPTQER